VPVTNGEVADRFELMADLLEANDIEFKPRAYRRAAESVRGHPRSVADVAREDPDRLEAIEGVGSSIADKIVEYVRTGEIAELNHLREQLPVEMDALTRVQGVGPKTVATLYEALGVRTLDDLERAAENGEIRSVSGFGPKSEQNILDGVAFARSAGERQLLGRARPVADDLLAWLRGVDPVEQCEVAGSIRRWRATVGDVDVLVGSDRPGEAVSAFTDADRVEEVIEAGTSKAAIRAGGLRVDLRVVAPGEFGAALQYFTGSRGHNVHLRTEALERDVSLNEYGAFDVSEVDDEKPARGDAAGEPDDGKRTGERIAGETERSMYEAVDLPWIPPELREDRGEIEAARERALPDLIEDGDVCGDLHVHTDWSDGGYTVEEMAAGAAEFGHEYVCITDHATGPGVVGGMGLSDEEIRDQVRAVREVDDRVDAVEVLAGIETNVDADGGISVGDDTLDALDLVVASPHSGLGRTDDATDRLVAAVEHPAVDVLGHPTGRLLDRRSGLTIDPARLGAAAADAGVALEVNSNPSRLDLDGAAVTAAIEAGAQITIDTDAHRPGEYANVRYGVHTARRGWAEREDVINARPVSELRAFLD
jgi:DNA polymerase (family 10)